MLQHMIAHDTVIGLIHDLEIIQPKDEDCSANTCRSILRQCHLDAVLELVFVQQAGDLVRLIALGHARHHADQETRLPVTVKPDTHAAHEPEILPFPALHAIFHRVLIGRLRFHDIAHHGQILAALLLMHQGCPACGKILHNLSGHLKILHQIRREHRRIRLKINDRHVSIRCPLDQVKEKFMPPQCLAQENTTHLLHALTILAL